jgi:hypothetical protein
LDATLDVDADTATLAWLVSGLEHARARGQTKLVGYLEAVVEDVVFEVEAAARRLGYPARLRAFHNYLLLALLVEALCGHLQVRVYEPRDEDGLEGLKG